MIATLRGTVQSMINEGVILDVNGVGYEVFLPPVVAQALEEQSTGWAGRAEDRGIGHA